MDTQEIKPTKITTKQVPLELLKQLGKTDEILKQLNVDVISGKDGTNGTNGKDGATGAQGSEGAPGKEGIIAEMIM